MNEKIEPALTAENWTNLHEGYHDQLTVPPGVVLSAREIAAMTEAPSAAVAIGNDSLRSEDLRKITRPKLAELRTLIAIVENDRGRKCEMAIEFVDALESLLPPIAVD